MIDQEQAIEIARKIAQAEDWAFAEPIYVVVRKKWTGAIDRYEIETAHGLKGSKANFTIDAKTGEIQSKGYISR